MNQIPRTVRFFLTILHRLYIFCFSLAEQEAAGVYYNALWKKGGQGSAVQPSEYEDDYVLEVGGGC